MSLADRQAGVRMTVRTRVQAGVRESFTACYLDHIGGFLDHKVGFARCA